MTHDLSDEDRRRFARIVSRAWSDDAFGDRYHADPVAVLAEHGIDHPHGIPLPDRPSGDFSLEGLDVVVAGSAEAGTYLTVSSVSCSTVYDPAPYTLSGSVGPDTFATPQ